MHNHRSLIEESSYEAAVAGLGGSKKVDGLVAPILEALSCNPLGFPLVPGCEPVRIAKTKLIIRGRNIIPASSVRFYVSTLGDVHLLDVRYDSPDEMLTSDTFVISKSI